MTRPVIVVGIDYSPPSEHALEAAIRTAKDLGAEIQLVHALTPLGAPGLDLQHPAFGPRRNETSDVATSLTTTADAWVQKVRSAGVPCTLVSVPGLAANILVDHAQRIGARAIVVGSHGRSGLKKAVLGSVAESVLSKSTVPVLVVPGARAAA